jgi:diaminopimelate decarboxylase
MGIADKVKSTLKNIAITSAGLLPNRIFQRLVHTAPSRLLRLLSHINLKDKYVTENTPPKETWGITSNGSNHMVIQGCDCVDLARHYETPLFVVDLHRLKQNYRYFFESFHQYYPLIEVGYSYKTNPLPGALKALHDLGASAEVVSPNELGLALQLKVPAEKIIYNGPGKTKAGLDLAVANRINLINIDGFSEIETLGSLAKKYGHEQQVGVRVVTSVGWTKKFGFSIKSGAAYKAFELLKMQPNLKPCGLHFHLSTGVTDVDTYLTAVRETLIFADRLKQDLDLKISYLDFGGGFHPVASVHNYSSQDIRLAAFSFPVQEPFMREVTTLESYGQKIGRFVQDHYHDRNEELPKVVFEPGRAITCSAQFLLLKVLDIKAPEYGVSDVILDGGRNVAAPTRWGCHQLFNASRINDPTTHYYTLYGPSCTPDDGTYEIKRLPELGSDDILAIMDAGAYFISTQSNFCSFPKPAAVMIEDGQHQLIRKRESLSDLFDMDIILDQQQS